MIPLRSKTTKKLLSYFFINPHESLYVNELARLLGLDKRNLVKKIRELEAEGILISQNRGNMRLYSIDKTYALYDEYRNILMKTEGIESRLKRIIKGARGIRAAYIYGSYAANALDTHSDIDLLVVGTHSIMAFQRELNKLQKEIGREINVVNMDEPEFKKRTRDKDPFLSGILKEKNIKLI
jgi:predicted nucleotidyltransferase/biotin operon repressor